MSSPYGRAFARAMQLVAVSTISLSASQAHAQEAERATPVEEPTVEDIVVTGSRISRNGTNTPTPVTVVDATLIQNNAATSIAEVLNQTPAFRASNGPNVQFVNFNANPIGIRSLDLRGLGPTRTLVLVDGRRFVPSTVQNTVDLNQIPTLLIARTDIVTGGASAAYGSDAVAGVVNVVLDTQLRGLKGTVQYGQTEKGDGETFLASLAGGTSFADNRVRVIAGFEFEDRKAVGGCYSRAWCAKEYFPVPNSAAATNGLASTIISSDVHASTVAPGGVILGYRTSASPASQVNVFGAAATNPLRGIQFDPLGNSIPFIYGSFYGPTFMVGGSGHGVNPLAAGPLLSPAIRRYNGYGHVDVDVSDAVQAYIDVSYGHSKGVANGPSLRLQGPTAVVLTRDNPYLPANILTAMTQVGAQSIVVGRQSGDFGNPIGTGITETYRGVAGFKGDMPGTWKWDLHYQYGRSNYDQTITNNQNVANFSRAVNAVRSASGQIVCRVNQTTVTDPNCSPLNIIGAGNASAESQAYAFGTSTQRTVIKQQVVSANAQGDVFSITTSPVSVAVGIEYRRDSVDARSDPISRALGYYINTGTNLTGRADIWEGYAEVNAPILRDSAIGNLLDLNGAIRRIEYGLQGQRFLTDGTMSSSASSFSATTWKLGAVYEPIDDLRFRATRSRDIRAPNISELYSTETAVVAAVNGITVSRRTGGNPNLTPEIADTWTVGGVLTPSILRGFNFSVDYFDIKVKDAISALGVTTIVNGCSNGNQAFCDLITFTGKTPSIVRDPNFNVAQLRVRGIDFETGYRFDLSGDSRVDLRLLATRNLKYVAADGVDRIGQTGIQTQALGGVPKWTLNGNANLEVGPFGATVQGRYITSGKYDVTLVGPEDDGYINTAPNAYNTNRVASRFYVDLNLRYTILNDGARRAQLFFGVQNLFDRDPPVAPSNAVATNPVFFDTFGRRFSGGIRFGI
jgi:iron complex outermembrane receptor protein